MDYINDANNQEPKSCPFCGCDNVVINEAYHSGGWDEVVCSECGAGSMGWDLDDWNRRSMGG